MTDLTFFISAFVTLFVVIDPIGMAPVFVALTQGQSAARRRAIAVRACVLAFLILALFGVAGEAVLGFVGITMPAFRIAGGLLLFLTALEMLFERRTKRRASSAEEATEEAFDEAEEPDPSVFPLAVPLIAGPGAIASMILLTGRAPGSIDVIGIHVVMALVICLVLGMFLISGAIERGLGVTGVSVVTRVLGMLLAALSVQFVLDGLAGAGVFG
ncbi:MarC family protein [Tropicimonas sp. IMCC34011]|uniref:MarC family protein n=1 Tax=Tropicimonas sp. IMCC34011 TaxID=2248759 RepID=UPI000E2653DB|nr:MarC family protein [Tropicimonas sp. IMCC34011]